MFKSFFQFFFFQIICQGIFICVDFGCGCITIATTVPKWTFAIVGTLCASSWSSGKYPACKPRCCPEPSHYILIRIHSIPLFLRKSLNLYSIKSCSIFEEKKLKLKLNLYLKLVQLLLNISNWIYDETNEWNKKNLSIPGALRSAIRLLLDSRQSTLNLSIRLIWLLLLHKFWHTYTFIASINFAVHLINTTPLLERCNNCINVQKETIKMILISKKVFTFSLHSIKLFVIILFSEIFFWSFFHDGSKLCAEKRSKVSFAFFCQ